MWIVEISSSVSANHDLPGRRSQNIYADPVRHCPAVATHRPFALRPLLSMPFPIFDILPSHMIPGQCGRFAVLVHKRGKAAKDDAVMNVAKSLIPSGFGESRPVIEVECLVPKDRLAASQPMPWYKDRKTVAAAAAGMIGLVGSAFLAYRTMDNEGVCPWARKPLIAPVPWDRPLLSNTNLDDKLSHGSISRAEACKNFLKFLPLNNVFFWDQFLGVSSSSSTFAIEQQELHTGTCLAVSTPALSLPNHAAIDSASVLSKETVQTNHQMSEKNEPMESQLASPGTGLEKKVIIGPQEKSVAAALENESKSLRKKTKEEKKLREQTEKAEKKRLEEIEKAEKKRRKEAEKAEKKYRKEAK